MTSNQSIEVMNAGAVIKFYSKEFGIDRVNEMVAVLQKLHVFPINRPATKVDVLLLLWTLATGSTPASMEVSLMVLLSLQNENQRGFYADLCDIFGKSEFLEYILCVEFPELTTGWFGKIRFIDGSEICYGTVGAEQQTLCVSGKFLEILSHNLTTDTLQKMPDLKL